MNRVAIAAFDIRDEKLYLYQKFLLKEILKVTSKIILVSNSTLGATCVKWCYDHNIIFVQSNKIFDVSMWREILQSPSYHNMFVEVQELILLNDSFFGPIYPLEEVFAEMEIEKVDFWGISTHGKMIYDNRNTGERGISPRFLQRYFLVIREKMMHSIEWKEFWHELGDFTEYWETEQKFEFLFTEKFENKGFSWVSFCKTKEWEKDEPEKNMSYIIYRAYDLLNEQKIPIISKQIFINDKEKELCYHYGNESNRVLSFLKEESKYELDFIWEYLIDTINPYVLWRNLNLTYIFPKDKISCSYNQVVDTILIVHLYYMDLFEKNILYLRNLPPRVEIIITTDNKDKIEILRELCATKLRNKYRIILVNNKGREWGAFLLYVKKYIKSYKYFGFIHDKKSNQMFYSTVGMAFNEYIWENMLSSIDYVENVIELLEQEKRIGMLAPPVVYHGEFWKHSCDFWTNCFEGTSTLAKRLGLKFLPQREVPVLTVGSCFWGRVDVFSSLFKISFSEDDFPDEPMAIDGTFNHFLERILPFVVQNSGCCTGIILSNEYAKYDITNLRSMMQMVEKGLEQYLQIDTTSTWSTIQSMQERGKDKKSFWKRLWT